jgi:hypothetical protein
MISLNIFASEHAMEKNTGEIYGRVFRQKESFRSEVSINNKN